MDQAERLRDMVRGANRARVFAVTSGKGGVGKTLFAVNFALALAEQGKRVVLADVDIGLANADVLLSVEPRLHLGHVLSGEVSARDALTRTPGGLLLLAGCSGLRHLSDLEQAERDFLLRSLEDVETLADFVVMDTGAGISANVVQFSAAADDCIVITIPEPTAITDGYAVIKAVAREKGAGRIRTVVNMVDDGREALRASERIRAVARRFLGVEVEHLGHVFQDDCVRRAVRSRRPLLLEHPESQAARCIREIARSVLGEGARRQSTGFFKRFAGAIQGALR